MRRIHRQLVLVAIALGFACESNPHVNFRDDPFSILHTVPSDGVDGVAVDSIVTVVFSKELDPTSFDSSSFSIAADGTALNATIDVSDHASTLTPLGTLEFLKKYDVSVTADVRSLDGAVLASDFSFSFTTRDLPFKIVDVVSNPDPLAGDQFGTGVTAVDGNFVIAAPVANVNDEGAVYLFDGAGGALIRAIPNPDPEVDDRFGSGVTAVAGNFVVAVPNDGPTSIGSAYLFSGTSGTLVQTIANPNASSGDQFGSSVTAVGQNFVVVASNDDPGASQAGSVFLFNGNTGALILSIPNPDPGANDFFGFAPGVVAVGTNFVVAEKYDDPGGIVDAGSVYLFSGTTGALILAIPNPDPSSGNQFGSQVAAVGTNFVVVNQNKLISGGMGAGAAYLYDGSTGALIRYLPNPSPAAGDSFGSAGVTSVGGNLVVACDQDDPGAFADAGSVYLYDGTTGDLILAIPNPSPAANDHFGFVVAAVGENFVVGAPLDDSSGVADAGSAYLYNGTTGALIREVPNPSPGADDFFGSSVTAVGGSFVVAVDQDDPAGIGDAGSIYVYGGHAGTLLLSVPNPSPAANDRFSQGGVVAVGERFVVPVLLADPAGTSEAGLAYLYAPTSQ